jgi:hypothetical protein
MEHGFHVRRTLVDFADGGLVGGTEHGAEPVLVFMGLRRDARILRFGLLRTALENQDDLRRGLLDGRKGTKDTEVVRHGAGPKFLELVLEVVEDAGGGDADMIQGIFIAETLVQEESAGTNQVGRVMKEFARSKGTGLTQGLEERTDNVLHLISRAGSQFGLFLVFFDEIIHSQQKEVESRERDSIRRGEGILAEISRP